MNSVNKMNPINSINRFMLKVNNYKSIHPFTLYVCQPLPVH